MEAKELRLAIVPLDSVLLHEEIERNRVDRLVEHLRRDRILKNPPIVTQVLAPNEWTRYVVLDGASRTSALRAMQCRDVMVQIVDYHSRDMRLESWNHLLLDVTPDELRREIGDLDCVALVEMDRNSAGAALERRELIGYLLFSDGRVMGLRCPSDQISQANALNAVVQTYENKAVMYRVSTTDLEQLAAEHHRIGAVMVFPKYRPEEIIRLALNGAKVPMGITRHIIPGRALRVNLPLEILENSQPLKEKNAWLDEWVRVKIRDRNVRFYQEAVFLFDE
jgi:L-serine kinase (ATP) / ParB family transcriptional regulator, heme-responsive regulator